MQTPSVSYPVAAAYSTPGPGSTVSAVVQSHIMGATADLRAAPTYVVPSSPHTGRVRNSTYAMPIQPSNATPTLAPAPGPAPADAAPTLSGSMSGTISDTEAALSPSQSGLVLASKTRQRKHQKRLSNPFRQSRPPAKPIPDNRSSSPPNANGSHGPLDPNSRTASSMPMLRPGTRLSTPWPIAKTTAALMPVVADDANGDADGWHAAR